VGAISNHFRLLTFCSNTRAGKHAHRDQGPLPKIKS